MYVCVLLYAECVFSGVFCSQGTIPFLFSVVFHVCVCVVECGCAKKLPVTHTRVHADTCTNIRAHTLSRLLVEHNRSTCEFLHFDCAMKERPRAKRMAYREHTHTHTLPWQQWRSGSRGGGGIEVYPITHNPRGESERYHIKSPHSLLSIPVCVYAVDVVSIP